MYKVDIDNKTLKRMTKTTFCNKKLKERYDIQEWVEKNPEIIDEDLLIIGKEVTLPSDIRIDLLAIDKKSNLVIIELKRDDSGRNVDWQAIKYASYCSNFTNTEIFRQYAEYLGTTEDEAETEIEKFIEAENFEELNNKQRIILVSKEFHSDVISAVLWLRDYGIELSCVRFTPYIDDIGDLFIAPTKIIPLPEAEDYLIKKEKKQKEVRQTKSSSFSLEKSEYDNEVLKKELKSSLTRKSDLTPRVIAFLEIILQENSKRDDLTDTQTEHEINLVVNGLDDFVNDVQTTYDDYSDKLKSSLEMQTEIINDANKMYAESYNSIKEQINNLLKSYGVNVSLSSKANFSGLVGFASGGSVAGQIRKNGDSLLASVNPGETILTQDFTKMLPDLVGTMKDFVNIDVPNYSNFTRAKTPIVNINYDGNLVNVEGSATTSTIDELRKLTPQIAKEVTKTITQDIKKNGFK